MHVPCWSRAACDLVVIETLSERSMRLVSELEWKLASAANGQDAAAAGSSDGDYHHHAGKGGKRGTKTRRWMVQRGATDVDGDVGVAL